MGGGRRAAKAQVQQRVEAYAGWQLPFASTQLSAILEKEFRYVMRNAQLRMMALMPLILIVLRLVNSRHFGNASQVGGGASPISSEFFLYGQGLIAAGGVLYVFLILSGLSCNLFAFEEGGMRTLILAPVERRKILLGKNIVVITVALLLSLALLGINQLIFSDLSVPALIFTVMSFVIYGSLMSVIGNWFSIRFPKRMKMGKRMNVSGVVGLLLIPLIGILALPPLAAVAAGYLTQSLLIEYVTLSLLAVICLGLYVLVIGSQGELLARREVEVLETVREQDDD
jgi:predicted permease